MNERQFAEAVLFATFAGVPLIAAGLFGLCRSLRRRGRCGGARPL